MKSWSAWKDFKDLLFFVSRSVRLDFDLDLLRHECSKEHFVHLVWGMTWGPPLELDIVKVINAFLQNQPILPRIQVPHTAHNQQRYLNGRVAMSHPTYLASAYFCTGLRCGRATSSTAPKATAFSMRSVIEVVFASHTMPA